MKNGIPNYNEIIFTKEQKEEIVRLYVEEKLSTTKIGKIMNCSYNKIYRILDEFGIKRVNNEQENIILMKNILIVLILQIKLISLV